MGLGLLGVLFILVRTGQSIAVPFDEASAASRMSTDPANLPYYAARSLLRMCVALGLSVVFTFVCATWATRSRRAEKVLVPLLEVLQSVQVLGFLAALLPLLDAAQLLDLVTVADADVHLTDAGTELAVADTLTAKQLFADAVVQRAPLPRTIHRGLVTAEEQRLGEDIFLRQLQPSFTTKQARHQLETAIDWGRYAELFEYDSDRGQLTLDPAAGERQNPLDAAEA